MFYNISKKGSPLQRDRENEMLNNLQNVKEKFNEWALSGRADVMANGHKASVEKMLKLISGKKINNFIDIGCGNGWVVREFSKREGAEYCCGIDLSDEMINLAKSRRSRNIEEYIATDFLGFESDRRFDLVFSMEVFYYFNDIHQTLKKVKKLLSDDGVLLVGIDFYKENEESETWPKNVGLNMQRLTIKQWKDIFINHGFSNVKISQIKNYDEKDMWKSVYGTLVFHVSL